MMLSTKLKQVLYMYDANFTMDLMLYLVKTYTDEPDLVLDNTMGSGITCLAAKQLNRKFIGIEKESKYYEIACQRCGF
jgi:DNA modification methylase